MSIVGFFPNAIRPLATAFETRRKDGVDMLDAAGLTHATMQLPHPVIASIQHWIGSQTPQSSQAADTSK